MPRRPDSPSPNRVAASFGAFLLLTALAAVLVCAPGHAGAQAPADTALACGKALSPPVLARWTIMGGAGGALGCPQSSETATATSPQGSSARQATFARGAIVSHGSGPRSGQTYAVTGCAWRLWFQYGAASGWLGLPVEDVRNTPDGQRQAFEGGTVIQTRATGGCDAERAPATETVAAGAGAAATALSPLDQFHDPARDDWLVAASASSVGRAVSAGYQRVRNEGYVLTGPAPGAVPLKAWWNEDLGAHDATATDEGGREALAAGYAYDGAQGWIWADPRPGTRPLKRFWNAARGHSLVTATPQGEADARAGGYAFTRIEGYVAAAP